MKHVEGIGVALLLLGAFSFGVSLLTKETTILARQGEQASTALVINAVPVPTYQFKNETTSKEVVVPMMTEQEIVALKQFLRATYRTEILNTTPYFDTDTKALLLKYQRDNTLLETGVLDTATRKSINDAPFRARCPKVSGDVDASFTPVSPNDAVATNYVPASLIALPVAYAKSVDFCLTQTTRDAVMMMIDAAKIDGISIKVSSAFRSYATQSYLYKMHFDILKLSRKTVARAGHSEHQLGVAVDLTGASVEYKSASALFATSPEYGWLLLHAHEYGFVQSYPGGKEMITGYAEEPWHFRYVGKEHAKSIHDTGVTVYEYLSHYTK